MELVSVFEKDNRLCQIMYEFRNHKFTTKESNDIQTAGSQNGKWIEIGVLLLMFNNLAYGWMQEEKRSLFMSLPEIEHLCTF